MLYGHPLFICDDKHGAVKLTEHLSAGGQALIYCIQEAVDSQVQRFQHSVRDTLQLGEVTNISTFKLQHDSDGVTGRRESINTHGMDCVKRDLENIQITLLNKIAIQSKHPDSKWTWKLLACRESNNYESICNPPF